MRASLLFAPLVLLGLGACSVAVHDHPAPRETTVVTPSAPPATVYAAPPGTTVVTRP